VKIALLNGPNLDQLGKRQPEIYGSRTLAEIEDEVRSRGRELGAEVVCFHSNHEGALIDWLAAEGASLDGVLLNPGALSATGYALADALLGWGGPAIEVHMSNVHAREAWRSRSVIAGAVRGQVVGLGLRSYTAALDALVEIIAEEKKR
jgi:3-dehydroquinate dehydratase-2